MLVYCQVLCMDSGNSVVPDTGYDSLLFMERTILVFFHRGRHHALHANVALHVAGQQCRSHLGYKTIRQVSVRRLFVCLQHAQTQCRGCRSSSLGAESAENRRG